MEKYFGLNARFIRIPIILASLVATVYLLEILIGFLSQFSQILEILLGAWIITIILRPVVNYLVGRGVSRNLAILITFSILFLSVIGILIYIIPQIITELSSVGSTLGNINYVSLSSYLSKHILVGHNIDYSVLKQDLVNPVNSIASFLVSNSISTVTSLFNVLLSIFFAFFFAFFMIQKGDVMNKYMINLIPETFRDDYQLITKAFDLGLSSFIRGQVVVALIYSVIGMIAMKALGLNLVLIAGIFSFVTIIVPLIGGPISVTLPLFIAITHNIGSFIILAVILIVAQQILINILLPKIFSKNVDIHPAIVILAILIGFQLLGVIGGLLALPIASVIQMLVKYTISNNKDISISSI